jgi:predicted N-acetyltransferase YhbS
MITVLADSGQELVGYAQLRRSEPPPCVGRDESVEIYRFYVDASAHGSGVAQGLMAEALAAARDLGGRRVWLGVWERNERARAFYKKGGFQDVGTQIFQLGTDHQTDRVLVREIGDEALPGPSSTPRTCQECGAALESGRSCSDYFDELLALEWQVAGGPGEKAHFLAIASYQLQHPSLLAGGHVIALRRTLGDVIAGRATVADAVARARASTEGSTRVRRRTGEPVERPSGWPAQWPMTVRDVCRLPVSRYLQQVHAWATSVDSSLP